MQVLKSIALFGIAGLCEIIGGYLIWLWAKESKPTYYLLVGGALLFVYGIVATLQTSSFGRVYATYGGIFVVMSLVWAYKIDNYIPDKYDLIGTLVVLIGVCIIFYSPREIDIL
ncbi:MAG: YnfA family protein [Bacteroidota bacterium]|nr:YnfA family protein [Bacteroidota bacterium]